MTSSLRRRGLRRHPGLYRARVVDANDPLGTRRVQVSVPSLRGSPAAWAPTLRGLGPPPQVGDEVLVGFEGGRQARPYVVGVLATSTSASLEVADDNGNSLRLTAAGIEIVSSATLRLTAPAVEVTTGSVRVDTSIAQLSGVVECSTLVADSVVAASYSPGAGNVW